MKEEMRKKYRQVRKNVKNRKEKDLIIYNKIINKLKFESYETVLIYVSNDEEVSTIELINYFIKYKKVAVPKVINNNIDFYYIDSIDELSTGYFGILEPTTNKKVSNYFNAICITPGICFSKDNYRIGYGGGFYDRFFHHHPVYSIGLCYKECLVDKVDIDKFDRKVNLVITD